MFTVYIIYSPTLDNYYIGITKNLQITLWQHNARAITATAAGKPWEVRFSQSFDTRKEAKSLEMNLKNRDRTFWEEFMAEAAQTA